VLVLSLFWPGREGATGRVDIKYSESEIFSELEIQSAMEAVLANFKDYRECELTRLWYDDDTYMWHVDFYMEYGSGSVNGVRKEDVIIILGEFYVGEKADIYFRCAAMVRNWMWILLRDSVADEWVVDDAGWAK